MSTTSISFAEGPVIPTWVRSIGLSRARGGGKWTGVRLHTRIDTPTLTFLGQRAPAPQVSDG